MRKKGRLLSFVCFVSMLVGAMGSAHAESELSAVRAALHEHTGRWVAGETSISRLPAHERGMRVRLIKPHADGLAQVTAGSAPQTASIAPTLDWTNNGGNFVTPVKDQGNCGSCWAFATTAALESFLAISHNTPNAPVNLSEQILVSCSGAGSCNGGYIDQASNYVRNMGLPPESDYLYTATNGACNAATSGWQLDVQKSQGWGWVATTSVSVTALKNALLTYGPLITTMDVFADFFYYTGGVYHHTYGTLQGGHAILIVGYDDVNQCFIVKNSWGTGWGERGFFRIGYSEVSSAVLFGQWTIANTTVAPVCTFSVSPASAHVSAAAGAGSVTVTASANTCAWTASSNNGSWIGVNPANGTGNGTVSYSVTSNQGLSRTGTMTIAGKTFTVNQDAASVPVVSVSPSSISFGNVRAGQASTKSVTISNKGGATLTTTLTITGQSASSFGQTSNCASVAPNGTCTAQVTFRPLSRTTLSATLNIRSNDTAHATVGVSLSGKGN